METKTNKTLCIKRVEYGLADTPREERDFKMVGRPNGPSGSISEWMKTAKRYGYTRLQIEDFEEVKGGQQIKCNT